MSRPTWGLGRHAWSCPQQPQQQTGRWPEPAPPVPSIRLHPPAKPAQVPQARSSNCIDNSCICNGRNDLFVALQGQWLAGLAGAITKAVSAMEGPSLLHCRGGGWSVRKYQCAISIPAGVDDVLSSAYSCSDPLCYSNALCQRYLIFSSCSSTGSEVCLGLPSACTHAQSLNGKFPLGTQPLKMATCWTSLPFALSAPATPLRLYAACVPGCSLHNILQ